MALLEAPASLRNPGITIPLHNLGARKIAWLDNTTRTELSHVAEALTGVIDQNYRFHFTPLSFNFSPADEVERARFLQRTRHSGWKVKDAEDAFHIETGYGDNIARNGLRKNTCIAALPEDGNEKILQQHPRLFLEAMRRTIKEFGKHAVPYKHSAFQFASGTLSELTSGLVIIDSSVPIKPKGEIFREEISSTGLLKPRTHFLQEDVPPDNILAMIPFSLPGSIPFTRGDWWYPERSKHTRDALLDALPDHVAAICANSGEKVPNPAKAVKTVELFDALRGKRTR